MVFGLVFLLVLGLDFIVRLVYDEACYLLYDKALRFLTWKRVIEEVVGLSPTGSLLLHSILPGEGLPHKKVANALVGHQLQGPKRFLH